MLDRLLTQRNVLLDEAFRVILAAGALEDQRADGALSMADWLAYRCRVSRSTARRWVLGQASALEDLPLIRALFVAGDLSFEQVQHALTFAQPADDEHLAVLLPRPELRRDRAPDQAAAPGPSGSSTTKPAKSPTSASGPILSGTRPAGCRASWPTTTPPSWKPPSTAAPRPTGPDPETGVLGTPREPACRRGPARPVRRRPRSARRRLKGQSPTRRWSSSTTPASAPRKRRHQVRAQRHHQRRRRFNGRRAPPGPLRHPQSRPTYDTADGPTVGVGRASRPRAPWLRPPGHRPRPPPMSMALLRPGDPPP